MNILKSLGIKSRREKIVERLLQTNQITAGEAIELLKIKETINVKVENVSSGARFTIGEDNSTESR